MSNQTDAPVIIATRGSALALAQANNVLAQCRLHFPKRKFEIRIIKTTGDKLQTASLAASESLPKGLFTKELEVALENHEADMAVHSLKDLPTDLPDGLVLGAVGKRADARDVLIYRDARWVASQPPPAEPVDWSPGQRLMRGFKRGLTIADLPPKARIATSSTRRQSQLQAIRPDLEIVPMRGNVGTRLGKLATQPDLDATLLAAAGLFRLRYRIFPGDRLLAPSPADPSSKAHPPGLLAVYLEPEEMIPCVGQAAVGIEIRAGDKPLEEICAQLNHPNTMHCVTAERAFLRAMGGGCQSPVAAYAQLLGHQIRLRAVSFRDGPTARRTELFAVPRDAVALGEKAAKELGGVGA